METRLLLAREQFELRPESDTGASSSDHITSDNTPSFDVTIDEAGRVDLDFDGDGQIDASQESPAAATLTFTSPQLADGRYQVTSTFDPISGSPLIESLTVRIDTVGPVLSVQNAGGALQFDGVDDLVVTQARNWGFSTTATVSAWIRTTDAAGTVLALSHDEVRDELLLYVTEGRVGIFNHSSLGNYVGRLSDSAVNTGEWVHVAGVIEGGGSFENLRIFVNGQEETGGLWTGGSPVDITDAVPRAVTLGWREPVWSRGLRRRDGRSQSVECGARPNRSAATRLAP